MEKQNVSSSKIAWPFKALGRCTKKMAVGFVSFCKDDELQELSESLDKAMGRIAVSLDKIKKSAEKYREHSETIMAYKQAGQNLECISNEIAGKNKKLKNIATEARRSSYLHNRIWQNRQN